MIHLPSNRRIVADLLRAVGTYHRRARMITSHRLLASHLRLVRIASWGLVLLAAILTVEVSREIRRLAAEWSSSRHAEPLNPHYFAANRKKVADP